MHAFFNYFFALTIKKNALMNTRNLLFSLKEKIPDSESYTFRKLLKFAKRWCKNVIFYSIFQKVIVVKNFITLLLIHTVVEYNIC